MNFFDILLATGEYLVAIPIFLLCSFTVKKDNRIKNKILYPVSICSLFAICMLCGITKVAFTLNSNPLLLPIMLAVFVLLFSFYKTSKIKLWYIFISVSAVFSFAGLSSHFAEAIITDDGSKSDIKTYGLIVKWILIAVFITAYVFALPKIKWLIENEHLSAVWKFVWIIPLFIISTNIIMTPQNYSYVSLGRIMQIYIIADTLLLVLYLLFQIMLYFTAKAITDKSNAEKQSRILAIQANQYESLKNHIEATSRLRHDFLHIARTAGELVKNSDNTALIKLFEDYGVSLDNSHSRKIFCKHSALNAIIGYYYDEAIKHDIDCKWLVSIPDDIFVSDIDLCSVVGNLLKNAIEACETVQKDKRNISFKADVEVDGDIYIVLTNTFDGIVKKDKDKYLSTKTNGHGIGLESIKTTVKKYNGFVNFYNDNEKFYTDIMLRQSE